MERLTRLLVSGAIVLALSMIHAGPVAAFDGFGEASAEATFEGGVTFEVELRGGAPDLLELLISTPGADGEFVAPVEPTGDVARYVWDTSVDHLTPNTTIAYRWRATVGDEVTESEPETVLHDDDRAGLDWQAETLGEATVHWYGDAEDQARRFGEITADGVERAEDLLGVELAAPVDIFVYESREEFFGALGPGAREWTGAAAFPELRTIFMWLGGGSESYLEVAMVHEVTHIVFHDATDNPFHEPATWLNEGVAVWSETQDASAERNAVAAEASSGGLLAFEALSAQFPIDDRGGRLAYAEGAAMIDLIIDRLGTDALAAIAAAYRDGASDAQALEAGTGIGADELYADFFAEFGVGEPERIEAEEILPSDVERPPADDGGGGGNGGGDDDPPAAPSEPDEPDESTQAWVTIAVLVAAAAIGLGAAVVVMRRSAGRDQAQ